MRNPWMLLLLLVAFCAPTYAQVTKTLKKTIQLKMAGDGGSNGASVAYHSVGKKYYAVMAGNSTYPLCVFDATGKLVAGGDVKSLIDVRGLWYNPKKARLQGNGYDNSGWFDYKLDPKGIPTDVIETFSGSHQPSAQTVGAYNSKENEVWFFDGEDVYCYDAQTAEVKETISLSTILEDSDLDPENIDDTYNSTAIIYTGKPGMEIGLLNYFDNQIELFSRTGKLGMTLQLPDGITASEMFCFAYANNQYWLFNKDTRTWLGFTEGDVVKKSSSSSPSSTNVVSPAVSGSVASSSVSSSNARGTYGKYSKILKPGDLYSSANLASDYANVVSEFTTKLGSTAADEIVKRSNENGWPGNYASLSSRNLYRDNYTKFNTYHVANLGSDKVLLWIPKAENGHVESGMQLPYDIYMVYSKSAVSLGDFILPKVSGVSGSSKVSSGTPTSGGRYSRITDPGKLYTTMTLSENAAASTLRGMFGDQLANNIFKYSHEREYPSGISTLDGWRTHKEQYKDYKLYYIADIDNERVLLWVPASENKHMPADMIGSYDFYFVIARNGVSLGEKVMPSNASSKSVSSGSGSFSSFKRTVIRDAGQFYSTYDLQTSEPKFYSRLSSDVGAARAAEILKLAHENGWPEDINTFTKRDAYRNRFNEYNAWYAGEINTDKVLLWIPRSENKHMPAAMVGYNDMFVVYQKSSVTLGDLVKPLSSGPSRASGSVGTLSNEPSSKATSKVSLTPTASNAAGSFQDKLDRVILAYADNFSSITGSERPKTNEFDVFPDYYTTLSMPGAAECYLSPEMLTKEKTYVATYGEFPSKSQARKKFDEIVSLVDKARFSVGSMVKNDISDYSNFITQAWFPFMMKSEYEVSHKKLLLEVAMNKMILYEGKIADDAWSVVLRISHMD